MSDHPAHRADRRVGSDPTDRGPKRAKFSARPSLRRRDVDEDVDALDDGRMEDEVLPTQDVPEVVLGLWCDVTNSGWRRTA